MRLGPIRRRVRRVRRFLLLFLHLLLLDLRRLSVESATGARLDAIRLVLQLLGVFQQSRAVVVQGQGLRKPPRQVARGGGLFERRYPWPLL